MEWKSGLRCASAVENLHKADVLFGLPPREAIISANVMRRYADLAYTATGTECPIQWHLLLVKAQPRVSVERKEFVDEEKDDDGKDTEAAS